MYNSMTGMPGPDMAAAGVTGGFDPATGKPVQGNAVVNGKSLSPITNSGGSYDAANLPPGLKNTYS